MKKIIGIDLGTTNSCVAIMEGNQAKVIENQEGNRTTPSVVSFTEKKICVGIAAKRQTLNDKSSVVFSIKRLMGKKFSEVKDSNFPFKIKKSKNDNILLEIKDREISPQEISSYILKKIKDSAEDYIGEKIEDAVITVPAYFNDAQRNSTKEAGRIAGLNVKRIINEPTAAALAFGIDKNFDKDKKIAVYDLGGGTFDISIIELINIDGNKQFEVLSTNGDTELGGDDFDDALVNYIVEDFKKKENYDISEDKTFSLVRIREEAEKAKKELSSLKETEINIPFIVNDGNNIKHLHIKITRAKLESLSSKLIERTIESCRTALKDANLETKDIDDVILVGGMTRMISVQKAVEKFFGKKPKKSVNPDEAVAIGAAVQGQILSGQRKDILLLDVIPLSLGIETLGGVMSIMIKKNTTIPTKYSQVFSTAEDDQDVVSVKVFQGERRMVEGNKLLGEFNLEGIKPAPRGIPQIEVTFNVNSDGILDVSALDKSTGIKNNIVIKSGSGLSEEEIEKMIKDAKENDEIDKKNKELTECKNELEYAKNNLNKKITDINEKENEELILECKKKISESEKILEGEKISEIREKINEINLLVSKVSEIKK
ncbi:Chaperone protein DnaK [Candidatus Vidania fulgoroideae]|nr:Chaperone protein DnaK [Candidatus Vidania fulgoroideae]